MDKATELHFLMDRPSDSTNHHLGPNSRIAVTRVLKKIMSALDNANLSTTKREQLEHKLQHWLIKATKNWESAMTASHASTAASEVVDVMLNNVISVFTDIAEKDMQELDEFTKTKAAGDVENSVFTQRFDNFNGSFPQNIDDINNTIFKSMPMFCPNESLRKKTQTSEKECLTYLQDYNCPTDKIEDIQKKLLIKCGDGTTQNFVMDNPPMPNMKDELGEKKDLEDLTKYIIETINDTLIGSKSNELEEENMTKLIVDVVLNTLTAYSSTSQYEQSNNMAQVSNNNGNKYLDKNRNKFISNTPKVLGDTNQHNRSGYRQMSPVRDLQSNSRKKCKSKNDYSRKNNEDDVCDSTITTTDHSLSDSKYKLCRKSSNTGEYVTYSNESRNCQKPTHTLLHKEKQIDQCYYGNVAGSNDVTEQQLQSAQSCLFTLLTNVLKDSRRETLSKISEACSMDMAELLYSPNLNFEKSKHTANCNENITEQSCLEQTIKTGVTGPLNNVVESVAGKLMDYFELNDNIDNSIITTGVNTSKTHGHNHSDFNASCKNNKMNEYTMNDNIQVDDCQGQELYKHRAENNTAHYAQLVKCVENILATSVSGVDSNKKENFVSQNECSAEYTETRPFRDPRDKNVMVSSERANVYPAESVSTHTIADSFLENKKLNLTCGDISKIFEKLMSIDKSCTESTSLMSSDFTHKYDIPEPREQCMKKSYSDCSLLHEHGYVNTVENNVILKNMASVEENNNSFNNSFNNSNTYAHCIPEKLSNELNDMKDVQKKAPTKLIATYREATTNTDDNTEIFNYIRDAEYKEEKSLKHGTIDIKEQTRTSINELRENTLVCVGKLQLATQSCIHALQLESNKIKSECKINLPAGGSRVASVNSDYSHKKNKYALPICCHMSNSIHREEEYKKCYPTKKAHKDCIKKCKSDSQLSTKRNNLCLKDTVMLKQPVFNIEPTGGNLEIKKDKTQIDFGVSTELREKECTILSGDNNKDKQMVQQNTESDDCRKTKKKRISKDRGLKKLISQDPDSAIKTNMEMHKNAAITRPTETQEIDQSKNQITNTGRRPRESRNRQKVRIGGQQSQNSRMKQLASIYLSHIFDKKGPKISR